MDLYLQATYNVILLKLESRSESIARRGHRMYFWCTQRTAGEADFLTGMSLAIIKRSAFAVSFRQKYRIMAVCVPRLTASQRSDGVLFYAL